MGRAVRVALRMARQPPWGALLKGLNPMLLALPTVNTASAPAVEEPLKTLGPPLARREVLAALVPYNEQQ